VISKTLSVRFTVSKNIRVRCHYNNNVLRRGPQLLHKIKYSHCFIHDGANRRVSIRRHNIIKNNIILLLSKDRSAIRVPHSVDPCTYYYIVTTLRGYLFLGPR